MLLNLNAQSGSSLPSLIAQDTTLSLDNSPYYADASVTVNSGVTLNVESGVEILFAAGITFTVQGNCEMTGTSENPVKLIPQDSSNYWGGVRGSSGRILLNNVYLSGMSTAFNINYGVFKLSECEIKKVSGSDVIHINRPDTAIIMNSNFLGDRQLSKQDAIDCDNAGQGVVRFENNIFAEYSDDAIDVGNQSYNVIIRSNKINHCVSIGITVGEESEALIERNIVTNCKGGIEVHNDAFATILNNTLYQNNTGIFAWHNSDSGTPTSSASAEIINTIISQSKSANFSVIPGSNLEFNYSMSDTDTLPGETNLLAPVQFLDAENLDLRLQPTSPCVDSGDPATATDSNGSVADMGAISYLETGDLVINEILYQKSSEDNAVPFIELYNNSDEVIDLLRYNLSHSVDYSFSESVILEPDSFLIITNNPTEFGDLQIPVLQCDSGNLDSSGSILLEDNIGNIMDFVAYDSETPWPHPETQSNHSIELVNPNKNNAFAESWNLSVSEGGTPGYLNSITNLHGSDNKIMGSSFVLYQNYPNPFNPKTVIRYALPITGYVDLSIYNILGQKISTLISKKQSAGDYQVEWNASEFTTGVYICRLMAGNGFMQMRKLLLLK